VLAEKKDKSLANVLVNALIISPSLFCNSALEFRMTPLYQRENGPAEKLKFLESLKEHAYLQEHLTSVTIPDLLSLDICAPVMEDQTQTEDNPDDLVMAIAEKWNPTARTCIMSICKKGMPGIPLFADVGTSFIGDDHVITFAVSFKEEATFVAANMAAILFHLKGEVGLSFFPDYVRSAIRKQGWNESEDRPVTSGELQLDDTLKPYSETSNMRKLFKFDFSEMDDTPLKEDLQQSSKPDKDGVPKDKHKSMRESPGLPPKQLLYKDAFSVQSKVSAFVNPDGTRWVASATQRESYGDDTTQGLDRGDDKITIDTKEFNMAGAGVTNPDAEMDDTTINSAQMTRTSRSLQSARSLAQEKLQEEGWAQFNVSLANINERNHLEQEASKKEIEELKRQLQCQSLANQMPTQVRKIAHRSCPAVRKRFMWMKNLMPK
jgi:hypothetical protein